MAELDATFDTCAGCGASEKVASIAGAQICWSCIEDAQVAIMKLGRPAGWIPPTCSRCGGLKTCGC